MQDENTNPAVSPTPSKKGSLWWIVLILIAIAAIVWFLMAWDNTTPVEENDRAQAPLSETTDESEGSQPTGSNPATGSAGVSAGVSAIVGEVKEFTVEGGMFYFSPKEIRVKRGDRVKINFVNKEGLHDWVIDEFSVRTPQIQAGQAASVEFVADRTGQFEYYCSVGQHRQMGMIGTFIVK
jgi:plastocyanin